MSDDTGSFWGEVFALRGSITPVVLPRVAIFGVLAALFYAAHVLLIPDCFAVAPFEAAGAVLGLLLVMRSNAGYERWWEARKLWGGIANASRNLAIIATTQGPDDAEWRGKIVRWTAVFPHVARASLRGERTVTEVAALIGAEQASHVADSHHMPTYVAMKIGECLREAVERLGLDRLVAIQIDSERATLIESIGGCERILKTPLPKLNSIKIRRFIFLFLATVPLAEVHKVGWLTPFITMLVAYPILSLDQSGVELQHPFSTRHLSHLPLDEITRGIETNLLALLNEARQADAISPEPLVHDGAPRPGGTTLSALR